MHKTIRGKLVKQHGILIDVRRDGSVHIEFEDPGPARKVDMPEEQAIAFYQLLGNVLDWEAGKAD